MRAGDTPLIDAARHSRTANIAALLTNSADVNEPKTNGMTALFIACQEGHTQLAGAGAPRDEAAVALDVAADKHGDQGDLQ